MPETPQKQTAVNDAAVEPSTEAAVDAAASTATDTAPATPAAPATPTADAAQASPFPPMHGPELDEEDRTLTLTDDNPFAKPDVDIEPLPSNPGLSIAAVIFGIVAVILALVVSWILSVVAGVVAIALGIVARRQNAPYDKAALAGIALGVLCIVANIALVVTYIYQLASLGII